MNSTNNDNHHKWFLFFFIQVIFVIGFSIVFWLMPCSFFSHIHTIWFSWKYLSKIKLNNRYHSRIPKHHFVLLPSTFFFWFELEKQTNSFYFKPNQIYWKSQTKNWCSKFNWCSFSCVVHNYHCNNRNDQIKRERELNWTACLHMCRDCWCILCSSMCMCECFCIYANYICVYI